MAFLEHLKHDVFISYAHKDNLPDREGEKGWVEELARQLKVRLLKRAGRDVAVWRDPELARAQVFDQVIEEAVRGAGVMISLISPTYLNREYCAQEIAWFRDQAQTESGGLEVAGYRRIFPVLLYNLPPDQWPEECRGTSGFRFHTETEEDLGEPLLPGSDAFEERLGQLVKELHTVLLRLVEKGGGEPGPPRAAAGAAASPGPADGKAAAGSTFHVFVSATADNLGPTRRKLAADLQREGLEVITNVPPPEDEEGHAAAVREALEGADLSVHLLSDRPGEPFDEDDPTRTYPVEQLRLGLEHARSQLVLMPDELDFTLIQEDFYRELLDSLRERERDAERLELVQVDRHRMLAQVLAKRRRLEEAAQRAATAAAGAACTTFIDLHPNDFTHAAGLVSYLTEKQVPAIAVPSGDTSPTLSLFEQNLRQARLFLVVFGTVAREWVMHRLEQAIQLIMLNTLPTKIGVYVAPPEKSPEAMRFPGLVQRIDGPGDLDTLLAQAAGAPA